MSQPVPGKIVWRARRGILELDVLLNQFIQTHYHSLPSQQQQSLVDLLEEKDQQLVLWLIEGDQHQLPACYSDLVHAIRQSHTGRS